MKRFYGKNESLGFMIVVAVLQYNTMYFIILFYYTILYYIFFDKVFYSYWKAWIKVHQGWTCVHVEYLLRSLICWNNVVWTKWPTYVVQVWRQQIEAADGVGLHLSLVKSWVGGWGLYWLTATGSNHGSVQGSIMVPMSQRTLRQPLLPQLKL